MSVKIQQLEACIADQDANFRPDNLIFSGLQMSYADLADGESTSSWLMQQIVSLCNDQLGCRVHLLDVSTVQTVPIKNRNGQPDQSSLSGSICQCLFVVCFTRCIVRDMVYSSRMKFKDYNQGTQGKIFINEDLDAVKRKNFSELCARVKSKTLLGAWS